MIGAALQRQFRNRYRGLLPTAAINAAVAASGRDHLVQTTNHMITPSSIPSTDRGGAVRTGETVAIETTRGFDRPFARVSWGAIFAGAVLALAVQLVLTLIGAAIGLATLNPATGNSPSGASFGAGAAIWWCISSLISLFLGGYFSARLAGTFNGWLHGLATWGTVTIVTIVLLTTAAGALIGGASGLANFVANNSNKTGQLPPAVQQQLDQLRAQASQTADQAAAQAQQPGTQPVDEQARIAADRAAKGGAVGSGAAAIALILGALAAAFGGRLAQRSSVYDVNAEDYTSRSSAAV